MDEKDGEVTGRLKPEEEVGAEDGNAGCSNVRNGGLRC